MLSLRAGLLAICLALVAMALQLALTTSSALGKGKVRARLNPPLWEDRDNHPVPCPKERGWSELYAISYNSWFRHLNLEKGLRKSRALNVNAWDEVPNSSWFSNRMGIRRMTFEEMLEGFPETCPEPGRWKVMRIRDDGYTPKVDIVDEAGKRFVLKFDLPQAVERNSGAERICTLIMHGAGYNVPCNSIVYFREDDLYLDENAYFRDFIGERRDMTEADLKNALGKLRRLDDGRYRGVASLFLEGQPLGPFLYTGIRKDDPNDLIPHEMRRELRGLRVIASWFNHVDVKDINALDMYVVNEQGEGYVRHHFLDFGSAMGSGDFVNGPFRVGHEYIFDAPATLKSLFTLSIWQRPWDAGGEIPYEEVGYFEADLFDPQAWKPNFPNLAFLASDVGDAYWGAKVVTAFSDDVIRQAVREGQYTNPEVTAYVEDVLEKRRDKIGEYWFDRVTPLEKLALEKDGAGYRLRFVDLALERGYAESETRSYRYWSSEVSGRRVLPVTQSQGKGGVLNLQRELLSARGGDPDRWGRVHLVTLYVQSSSSRRGWALPAAIFIGQTKDDPALRVLGWNHAVKAKP
jgi:hypothetical protein